MPTYWKSLPQRMFLLALFALIAGCTTAPTAPPVSVEGAWSSWPAGTVANPAGPLDFVLTESNDSVSGTGTWATQTYQVSGRYVKPGISLIFVSQGDTIQRFEGKVLGGEMIGADVTAQGVAGQAINYYRR